MSIGTTLAHIATTGMALQVGATVGQIDICLRHIEPGVDVNGLARQVFSLNYHAERRPDFFRPPEPSER